jgi:hypothetical protein
MPIASVEFGRQSPSEFVNPRDGLARPGPAASYKSYAPAGHVEMEVIRETFEKKRSTEPDNAKVLFSQE